ARGQRRRPQDLGPGAGVDHRQGAAPRDRRLHAVRGLEGPRPAVDDAGPRSGDAGPIGRARAEARLRPLPCAWRPAAAARRERSLSDYLGQLAAHAVAIRLDALPASAITATKVVLLDPLGALVCGSRPHEHARLARPA